MFLRYDLSRGQVEDVNEAITLHREARRLFSAPHSDRSSSLNNLATALHARFAKTGQIKDVDETIVLHRKAFGLRPVPHPKRSQSLNNLANVLVTIFEQTGQMCYIRNFLLSIMDILLIT